MRQYETYPKRLRWVPAASLLILAGLVCPLGSTGCMEPRWYCGGLGNCEGISDEESCIATPGCNFNGGCTGIDCASRMTESECVGKSIGCFWSAGACRGFSVCDGLDDQARCTSNPNCAWVPGCGGEVTISCRDFESENSCAQYDFCYWNEGSHG